jgi:hypothetical protein
LTGIRTQMPGLKTSHRLLIATGSHHPASFFNSAVFKGAATNGTKRLESGDDHGCTGFTGC